MVPRGAGRHGRNGRGQRESTYRREYGDDVFDKSVAWGDRQWRGVGAARFVAAARRQRRVGLACARDGTGIAAALARAWRGERHVVIGRFHGRTGCHSQACERLEDEGNGQDEAWEQLHGTFDHINLD
jgi:hypothetical protein